MDIEKLEDRYVKYITDIFSVTMAYISHGDKELRDKQLKEIENSWYQVGIGERYDIYGIMRNENER